MVTDSDGLAAPQSEPPQKEMDAVHSMISSLILVCQNCNAILQCWQSQTADNE